jgi:hypothetical protein
MSQELNTKSGAPARMADALLRSLGGSVVMLRVPSNAMAAQDAEQLGMSDPHFEEISIGPAVFRRVMPTKADGKGERTELLVSATTVLKIVGLLGFESASLLFAQAAGVVVQGALLQIVGVSSSEIFGQPYLYRVQLRGGLNVMA